MKFWKFVSNTTLENTTVKIFLNPDKDTVEELDGWVKERIQKRKKENFLYLDSPEGILVFVFTTKEWALKNEELRKFGNQLSVPLKGKENLEVEIIGNAEALYFAEGLVLSLYTFDKYQKKSTTTNITIGFSKTVYQQDIDELDNVIDALFFARDLVNEPPNVLNATYYAEELTEVGEEIGLKVEVLEEAKIESLKMGGLLAVNRGSEEPPTFIILEWKPENATNEKPLVFVGKGVTYDTGGLSIKPTPNSMDFMKADMGGSAAIVGAIVAIAKNQLPIHVVAMIPATDNRVGEKSFSPGDVITMYSGDTVEILNTDAEGRLVLADALSYAKKYDPSLVIDVATLTGAAARAIGKEGIVFMGNASQDVKTNLITSGQNVHERLVEFPLWDEYDEQLKSSIADFTNLGGAEGGAITAGKFLERFVEYDWLHLDIAGPAFLMADDSYRVAGGTGVGVRLLYDFVKKMEK